MCSILVVVFGLTGSAIADQEDLVTETLAIFRAKCAGCHGPDLPKPKGRFGYVLDLPRVRSNREMVVPASPEESELWELVSRGEMPPADSPTGPLSATQKDVIRTWIAAGAPAVPSAKTGASTTPTPEQDAYASRVGVAAYIFRILGPLHIVTVHFPIALLIAAAMGELCSIWWGRHLPAPAVRFCVLLGSSAAMASAALGWLHAVNGYGIGMPHVLELHRWIGTFTGLWSIGTMILCEWDQRRGRRSQWFRGSLFIAAALVAASGHFGGILVHGENFFGG
jgi:hypothetical protein